MNLHIVCLLYLFRMISTLPTDHSASIVGGEEVQDGQVPFMVSLQANNKHYCGGVIISPEWILTSGYCANKHVNFVIRYNTLNTESGGLFINNSQLLIHPDYDKILSKNDIALIHTDGKMKLGQTNAKQIELAAKGFDVQPNSIVSISGWGLLHIYPALLTKKLHQVQVPVVDREKCQSLYHYGYQITQNMFCVGDLLHGGKDFCLGDSGGPVIQNNRLVGIISWGLDCADRKYPGVHTRVGNYIDWIETTIKDNKMQP